MKRVLVTGVAGYVGSVLTHQLLDSEYQVIGVDNLMYKNISSIQDLFENPNFTFLELNLNKKEEYNKLLDESYDFCVHLAAIVGDPACSIQAEYATKTNYELTVKLAEDLINKDLFVFASTCSVYGKTSTPIVDESSKLNPVSLYGWTKAISEEGIQRLGEENGLKYTTLRFATAHGLSYRPRFDLVVNYFILKAYWDKEIIILGGGQWRPFIHVRDMARGIIVSLKNYNKTQRQIYNVGSDDENYTIKELGEMVKEEIPNTNIKTIKEIQDERSYRVSFDKIEKHLGYKTRYTVRDTIKETVEAFESKKITDRNAELYYNALKFKT